MDALEKRLRRMLNKNGYTLGRKETGYRIGDKVTNTVYLGEKHDATLEQVATFVDNMDELGFSSLDTYAGHDGNGLELYLEEANMEITNLSRYRDTLIQQGKHARAAELDEKIRELEEELAEDEEEFEQERRLRTFLEARGFRLEYGDGGFRISETDTGDAVLGKKFEAELADVAVFAQTLGMERLD